MHIRLIFGILFSALLSQARAAKLEIHHLTGDFYVFTTYKEYDGKPFPANGMYLITKEGAVLFDMPWDTTQMQPLLDSIKAKHGKDVILSISTHFHDDRTGGIDFLKRKRIKTYSTTKTDSLSIIEKNPRADILMSKDTVFTIGGHSFSTYYPGPGHTSDNIVVWFGNERILYVGCFIKSTEASTLGNLEDADVKAWAISVRNVQKRFKKPRYIIPGHQSWTSTKALEHTLELIKEYRPQ